jgi:hypothetical protein
VISDPPPARGQPAKQHRMEDTCRCKTQMQICPSKRVNLMEPDVAIREPKAGLFEVCLLGDNSVETHVAISQIGHVMSPDAQTKAHAAKLGFDKEESDKAETGSPCRGR